MKHIVPAFFAVFCLLHAAAASEMIMEDDFGQGEPGSVFDRLPVKGGQWQGLANVVEGGGLQHGGDVKATRSAVVSLDVPPDASRVTAMIRGVHGEGGQFRFGFTDNPADLLGEGANNRGAVWGYLAGGKVTLFAGLYGAGDQLQATLKGLRTGAQFELELSAEPVAEGESVPVTLTFNGQEVLAGSLLGTSNPKFQNFFIQFQEGDDFACESIVQAVSVSVE